MKYLLDTNICIHFFKGKFNLIEKFSHVGLSNCAISEKRIVAIKIQNWIKRDRL
jgi:predicted nucleic acid-binding protein